MNRRSLGRWRYSTETSLPPVGGTPRKQHVRPRRTPAHVTKVVGAVASWLCCGPRERGLPLNRLPLHRQKTKWSQRVFVQNFDFAGRQSSFWRREKEKKQKNIYTRAKRASNCESLVHRPLSMILPHRSRDTDTGSMQSCLKLGVLTFLVGSKISKSPTQCHTKALNVRSSPAFSSRSCLLHHRLL